MGRILVGTTEITDYRVGRDLVDKVYVGRTFVWERTLTTPGSETTFAPRLTRFDYEAGITGWVGGASSSGTLATLAAEATTVDAGTGALRVTNSIGSQTTVQSDGFEGGIGNWINASGDTNTTLAAVSSPVRTGTGAIRLTAAAAGLVHARVAISWRIEGLTAGDGPHVSRAWHRPVGSTARESKTKVNFFYNSGTSIVYYATLNSAYEQNPAGAWTEHVYEWTVPTPPSPHEAAEVRAEPSYSFRNVAAGEQFVMDDYVTTSGTASTGPDYLVARAPTSSGGDWSGSGAYLQARCNLPKATLTRYGTHADAYAAAQDAAVAWGLRYNLLRNYYAGTCGPAATPDATPVVSPTVTSQADADALSNKIVHGVVTVTPPTGGVIIRNVTYQRRKGTDTGAVCWNVTNNNPVTYENCTFDGDSDFSVTAVLGGTSDHKLVVRFCEFVNYTDAVRGAVSTVSGAGNSIIEDNYFREAAVWDDTVEGRPYDGATDPQGDAIQILRATTNGIDVRRNFVEVGAYDEAHTSAITVRADDGPVSSAVNIASNYLNGGGYQVRVHDGATSTVSANVVSVTDNLMGPTWGTGRWSYLPTTRTDVTRTGNLNAVTLAAVDLTQGALTGAATPPTYSTGWTGRIDVVKNDGTTTSGAETSLLRGWNTVRASYSVATLADVSRINLVAETTTGSGSTSVVWDTVQQGNLETSGTGEQPDDPNLLWKADVASGSTTAFRAESQEGHSNITWVGTPKAAQIATVSGSQLGWRSRSRFLPTSGQPSGSPNLEVGEQQEVYLTWTVEIPAGADLTDPVNLVGLAGVPASAPLTYAPNGSTYRSDAWRAMIRTEGEGLAVIFHGARVAGETLPGNPAYPSGYLSAFGNVGGFYTMPRDTPVTITMRVLTNNPGTTDGLIEVWVGATKWRTITVRMQETGSPVINTLLRDVSDSALFPVTSSVTLSEESLRRSVSGLSPAPRPTGAVSTPLLSDLGFETGTAGFVAASTHPNTQIERDTDRVHSGLGALKITALAAEDTKVISPAFRVTPGSRYDFALHTSLDGAAARSVGLQADWFSSTTGVAGGGYLSSSMHYATAVDPTSWSVREIRGVFPPQGAQSCQLSILHDQVTAAGEVLRLDSGIARLVGSATTPTVPTAVSASKSDSAQTASLSWSPPSDDGGDPITAYQVSRSTATGTVTLAATARTHTFTGLATGSHTLSVSAVNGVGAGPAASQVVTLSTVGGGTGTTKINEQFSTSKTITSGSSDPTWYVESGSPSFTFSGGIGRQSVSGGKYGRIMSRFRMGGPGKVLTASLRIRASSIPGGVNGSGNALGVKMPGPPSVTGYSRDDVRSVIGTGDASSPGYFIVRHGVNSPQIIEVVRRPFGARPVKYVASGSVGYHGVHYTTWRQTIIEIAWPVDNNGIFGFRVWVNRSDKSGTPTFTYTARNISGDYNQPGFLWSRQDAATIEWDYIVVEESA